jgi:transcriptional regulator with XRE-family HTH domain
VAIIGFMEDRRVGRLLRAGRERKGWRQLDVETACGVDQTSVSLIERGTLDCFTVRTIRLVADAVGVRLELAARMPAADVSRLLDEGHARLVEAVLGVLRAHHWETIVEYTFNHYGDRGSVDILAWNVASRTLLIIEVKTILIDVQDQLAALDRKARVVPFLVARERGWRPAAVGRLLVVEDRSTARRVVATHQQTFDSVLPGRSRRARAWVEAPDGPIGAVWFLSSTNGVRGKRVSGATSRVRCSS